MAIDRCSRKGNEEFWLDYSSIESALSITNSEEEKNERNQLCLSNRNVEEYKKRGHGDICTSLRRRTHTVRARRKK